MPTDIGRYFYECKFLYEFARILIEYVSVNVKVRKIMIIIKQSLIIFVLLELMQHYSYQLLLTT